MNETDPIQQAQSFWSKYKVWIIVGVIALILVGGYNDLVSLDTKQTASFSEIQNQEKRRADLVPNLVESVKGYASHEDGVFTKVTEARSRVGQTVINIDPAKLTDPAALQQMQAAQAQLTQALKGLIAVSERYPDLKASERFQTLMTQLEGTENRIATARGRYIDATREYNASIRQVPRVIYASVLGFSKKPEFTVTEQERSVPKVDFKTKS